MNPQNSQHSFFVEQQQQQRQQQQEEGEYVEQLRPHLQHPPEVRPPHWRTAHQHTQGPPTPPPISPPSPTPPEPDLYDPDLVFDPPAVARSYGRPVVIEGPYRRVPDISPLASYHHHQPDLQAFMNPAMATDFRDELARLDGVITPGIDNTPFVQYAIEALTRDRDTGYSTAAGSSSSGPVLVPGQQSQLRPAPPPQQQHPPVPALPPTRPPVAHPPPPTGPSAPRQPQVPRPFIPGPRESAHSLADSLLKKGSRPPQPHEWRPVERDELLARAPELPPLSFRPWPLRTPALLGFMVLCVLMIAALIVSAVYSQMHQGLLEWATIQGGRYFLFRIFPQLVAAPLLLYAQFLAATVFRILPFVRLASERPEEREGALFQELYPSFLWPRLIGPWRVWVPILVTWLMNFTIPLQSSLFTVILVGQTWTWATVQGVAWTLVALYIALLISTIIVWRYWATLQTTGLIWDPRSLADIAAIVSETNTAEDYRGTQLARGRDGIRFALRRRATDRLCYWTWKDGRHGFWHTLGSPMDEANLIPIPDLSSGQRMQRQDEKHHGSATAAERGGLLSAYQDHDAEHPDLEASRATTPARHRYLPWCLRTSQLLWFSLTAFILLLAILLASFLPATRITSRGFAPSLRADPQPGAFSAADFLYSFLPSLLGMLLFLAFQPLDTHLRVLQPWATLSSPAQRGGNSAGSPADRSLLADYAACARGGWSCTLRALRSGHWRVAVISLLSPLFILIPCLAGGSFMALTSSSSSSSSSPGSSGLGEVRIFPNIPAYSVLLALLGLYLAALLSLLPARGALRMPHAVTCLAEIVGYLVASGPDELRDEPAFKRCVSRDEMVGKLRRAGGGGGGGDVQSRWVFGFGEGVVTGGGGGGGGYGYGMDGEGGGGGELGVRRVKRFTEKRKVRKSQIRRALS